ncbi:MAG: hypothetical protein JSW05_07660 [Candidatus Thorarchaeota archaeon]|nr:MAG: hypothetical protein JSW05_07660 [Candidatus Thorarchaeota archaeon]
MTELSEPIEIAGLEIRDYSVERRQLNPLMNLEDFNRPASQHVLWTLPRFSKMTS